MQIQFEIYRQERQDSSSSYEKFLYESQDLQETVASALRTLNEQIAMGIYQTREIRWECSCLQKKCGACAMRINQKPMLACDARLSEVQKENTICLEPLQKFPVISDLLVDRSSLFENLKTLSVWLEQDNIAQGKSATLNYEASRCLQCGCCLEICPNFCLDDDFFGMSALVPASRILAGLPNSKQQELVKHYRKHIYRGCGKSLACQNVCPAGIDIANLMVNSNAVAIWKQLFSRFKKSR